MLHRVERPCRLHRFERGTDRADAADAVASDLLRRQRSDVDVASGKQAGLQALGGDDGIEGGEAE